MNNKMCAGMGRGEVPAEGDGHGSLMGHVWQTCHVPELLSDSGQINPQPDSPLRRAAEPLPGLAPPAESLYTCALGKDVFLPPRGCNRSTLNGLDIVRIIQNMKNGARGAMAKGP